MQLQKIYSTLAFLAVAGTSGCMSMPADLNLSLERPTAQSKYVAKVHALAEPIVINKMHAWEIRLQSQSGEPVQHARITVDGGMPQHGHGFPTQPRVTKELGGGRYLLEGMKFSMPGWWEIKLTIDSTYGTDKVTFNTVIIQPAILAEGGTSAERHF
ncbi:FixH family protein [Janthinobacterium sp. 17J80-10]|uniref:FixH family protein n=1 Tax=Janthinobacterium sp. 17J80-10 TaxID=2497863 RepID=UPI0010053DF7|nr:FixH family protein [Janthinobacterium sp. 17J80-10]QAU33051.1 Auxin-binding protein [Janthinobacterium sp. 17J80-10]